MLQLLSLSAHHKDDAANIHQFFKNTTKKVSFFQYSSLRRLSEAPQTFHFSLSIPHSSFLTPHSSFLTPHFHPHPIGISAELRRILALDQRIAVAEVAFLGDIHAVFELMHALAEEVDEELHVGVGVALIVPHAIVVLVP